MLDHNEVVVANYSQHKGTIRVAGGTVPHAAANCAYHRIQSKQVPVDLVCIGANAVNQAVKTLGVLTDLLKVEHKQVLFKSLRFRTNTFVDTARTKLQTKDCVVFRVVVQEAANGQES